MTAAPVRDPIVWVRCENDARLPPVLDIADQLNADGDAVQFLATVRQSTADFAAHPYSSRAVERFLTRYRPIVVICVGGAINSTVLLACEKRGTPVIMIEAQLDNSHEIRGGWFRARLRPALGSLAAGFAVDDLQADALRRLGAPYDRVYVLGKLEISPKILPCLEADRHDIAAELSNRPVWFARAVATDEIDAVLTAHRHAARRSHRLLLCLRPEDQEECQSVLDQIIKAGLVATLRSKSPLPDEACQVMIIDNAEEDGLWLRVAQTTFAGGTLNGGARHDPFESAALGSVVVHGMCTAPYKERFRRLLRARASIGVFESARLGPAIETLLSPDRAAQMAVAGWDTTSSGAEIANRIVAMIQDRLDQKGA